MQHTVARSSRPETRSGAPIGENLLVERASEGDLSAYDELVRSHYRRVHAAAFHLVGNHEDAEDLAQECFLRAHRSLRWFRGEGAFSGWLRRILVHLARDRFRRAARRPDGASLASLPEPGSERGPSHEAGQRELSLLVAEAVRRLPDRLRIALVLRTHEGLPYSEISAATGVTPATARTHVMKARRALLRALAPYVARGEP